MNRLLLIDGHNLHFQIFFGIRARLKKKPKSVSPFGVGFSGALKRIIRAANATHVLVIFDGEHENPRRALLPTYKANRPDYSLLPDDENPYLQLPAVYSALDSLKIKYIETTEVEADDLIAICTERYRNIADITVCSHDHDFYQLLVGGKVRLMHYSGKRAEFYEERDFREEFHISPRRFADYKALIGDKSDNIPGVRGVGSISATRLIGRFGGIENILERAPEIRQKKLRRCVIDGAERMRLNYKLVKLGGDPSVPAPFKLSELAYVDKNARPQQNRIGDESTLPSERSNKLESAETPKNQERKPTKKHSRSRHKRTTPIEAKPLERVESTQALTEPPKPQIAETKPSAPTQSGASAGTQATVPKTGVKKHRRRHPRHHAPAKPTESARPEENQNG